MSDDIVKALRELYFDTPSPWDVCCDAADEIERLRAHLEAEQGVIAQFRSAMAELRAELAAAEAIASFGEDDRIQTYFQKWKRENDKTLRLRAERDELRALLVELREWFTPEYECEMLDRIDAALNKGGDRD